MRTINANMLSMASANQPGQKGWYVLQVVVGREKGVENALREKNIVAYLPLILGGKKLVRRRIVQCADRPALPGYVMVSIAPSPAAFAGLARVRHVEGIVGGTETPHCVNDEDMSRFKAKLGEMEESAALAKEFRKDDWATFDEGPFAGLRGCLVKVRKMVLIRGEKPVPVEGVVKFEIAGKAVFVPTPLALLVKL
ncbi:transcription termination/antitermination NusG family protein [Sinorhizobium sp. 8-89]|uniref:transcription termination/antitermination protein NusG n=1 Tax=Sinorhizobium sp. 7-81 TaxID=3049087 RepID=UPI0024C36BA7|nr:transcription termination/antitermination NusG family protein [Sinorhizobium sp. 7-81]MDK1386355.1 transcription termination/antitermination NusG family protein [Sinorhizobium sp. 7-81]